MPAAFLQAGFILLIVEKLCLIMFFKRARESNLMIFFRLNIKCLVIPPLGNYYPLLGLSS